MNSKILSRLPLASATLGIVASGAVLLGWVLNFPELTRFRVEFIPMAPATAFCFVLLGVALLGRQGLPAPYTPLVVTLASAGLLFNCLLIFQLSLNLMAQTTFDIEQWFLPATASAAGYVIGRMSPLTAGLFICLAGAILLSSPLHLVVRKRDQVAQGLAATTLLVGVILVVGYWYGTPFFYDGELTPIALPTAVGFILLSSSLLCENSTAWLTRWLTSNSVASHFTRRLLPPTIGIILLAGWVQLVYLKQLPQGYEVLFFFILTVGTTGLIVFFTISSAQQMQASITQAEKALRESEARFRAVTETATEAIVTINSLGQLVYWNHRAEVMFGYTLNEVQGKSIEFMMPAYFRARHQVALGDVQTSGHLSLGGQVRELTGLTKAGREFPIELSLAKWSAQQQIFFTAIIRDVTERQRAAQALNASEHKHRMLLDNLPQKIFYKNRDSVYVAVNTAYAADLSCPPPAIVGKTDESFFPLPMAQGYRADDQRVMAAGTPVEVDERYMAHGREFIVHTIKIPIRNESNEVQGLLGIFWDITERKRAEAALQEAQTKIAQTAQHLQALTQRLVEVQELERRELARELHDRVGQNLTGININLSLIQSQLPPEVAQKIGSRLTDSSKLVEETIDRIRDVMGDLRPAVLDDYGLVATLRWHADRFGARTGLTIKVFGNDFAPRWDSALELAFFRITQEALHNIVKHAHATQVTITLDECPPRMCIVDNGQGFEAGHQHGWGLSIMRERAEAIGATFSIETMPAHGTRVMVEIAS